MFAAETRRKRTDKLRAFSNWRWHVDEVFVKINGERHYLWRAVDHEGEVLEAVVTKRRNKKAALKFLRKLMRRYGRPQEIVTDRLPSYRAALRELGSSDLQSTGLAGPRLRIQGECYWMVAFSAIVFSAFRAGHVTMPALRTCGAGGRHPSDECGHMAL